MRTAFGLFLSAQLLLFPLTANAQGAEAPEEMTGHVKVGDKAPGFTLKDQDGKERSLEGFLEKADEFVALVFYRSANW